MSLPSQALRKLTKEIAKLQRSPPEGIGIEVGEQDILDINGWIQGPAGTPYENGYFLIKFDFTSDFPNSPPKCLMKTKIFHPNIHSSGEICVSTLKKDWSSKYGIEHILLVIKCLLITPNPDSALDAEAGRLLQDAYSDYAKTASVWTRIHASHCPACLRHTTHIPELVEIVKVPSKGVEASTSTSSSAKPLEQSGSSNQGLLGLVTSGSITTSVDVAPIIPSDVIQKRKSDEAFQAVLPPPKKRQTAIKRGMKRL